MTSGTRTIKRVAAARVLRGATGRKTAGVSSSCGRCATCRFAVAERVRGARCTVVGPSTFRRGKILASRNEYAAPPPCPRSAAASGVDGASSKASAAEQQQRRLHGDDTIGRLSDGVRRALECPVCMELSCSISTCCENGHGTCDDCSYKMMQLHRNTKPKCPVCRSAAAPRDRAGASNRCTAQPPPPPTVRKLYELMSVTKVACAFRPEGCPKLVHVPMVSEHESICPYASQVRCMVSMCRWMGAYDGAFRHVSLEHQFSAYDVSVTFVRLHTPPSSTLTSVYARETRPTGGVPTLCGGLLYVSRTGHGGHILNRFRVVVTYGSYTRAHPLNAIRRSVLFINVAIIGNRTVRSENVRSL